MLRKLLFCLCLTGSSNIIAQVAITPVKTTEKPADTQIDFTKLGAPMPPLTYIVYIDTAGQKNDSLLKVRNDTVAAAEGHHKKRKKRDEDVVPTGVNAGVSKRILTNEDLDNGANLFVMMFNPSCSHCQDETMLLGTNVNLFKKSKVVLIADQRQAAYISDFIKYTRFAQYPFYLGVDGSGFINKLFLYRALPQINIYDKHRKLLKTFSGEIAIDSLQQYIQ